MTNLLYANQLFENRMLRTELEITQFKNAVFNLVVTYDIASLYSGFDDSTSSEENMYLLVYAIESFHEKVDNLLYFTIFINETLKILDRAKEWVKLLNMRVIKDNDCLGAYIITARMYDENTRIKLIDLMKEICSLDEEEFKKEVDIFINGMN